MKNLKAALTNKHFCHLGKYQTQRFFFIKIFS